MSTRASVSGPGHGWHPPQGVAGELLLVIAAGARRDACWLASRRHLRTTGVQTGIWLAGVPLHVALDTQLAPERLRAAPPSLRLASMTLRSSETSGVQPAQPQLGLVPALAGWAQTLTALHGMPLVELLDGPAPGLAGFTRLRSLALLQTRDHRDPYSPRPLPAALLPASLQDLTLTYGESPHGNYGNMRVPSRLVGFGTLPGLRTIALAGYNVWPLGRSFTESNEDDDEDGDSVAKMPERVQLPECLEVRLVAWLSLIVRLSSRPLLLAFDIGCACMQKCLIGASAPIA